MERMDRNGHTAGKKFKAFVGVPWEKEAFIELAMQLEHTLDQKVKLPPQIAKAIFNSSSMILVMFCKSKLGLQPQSFLAI